MDPGPSSSSRTEGGWSAGCKGSDTPGTEAFRRLRGHAAQLQEFISHLLSAKVDSAKASLQRVAIFAALGVVALCGAMATAVTLCAVLTVFFLRGVAGGLGEATGRLWAGELILGFLFFAVLVGGGTFGFVRFRRAVMERWRAKYEERKRRQRVRFGTSVDEKPKVAK
jgi:hypothetical protein